MATSAERMAATRARRRSGLVQFVVAMPISDRDEIARAGYEAIAGTDQRAAAEALRLFISNTDACLDTRGDSATQRRSRPLLRRHSSSWK